MSNLSQSDKPTMPKHVSWCWLLSQFLSSFGVMLPLTVLVFFITEYTGVSPVLMATVYTVARFADLGVSLFSGPIVQRMRRVRPLLLVIPIISGGGSIISFSNPNVSLGAKLVILIIGYCCIHFPMNFSTVVTNTIMMKMAGANPANRVSITQAIMRGMNAGPIVVAAMTIPAVMFLEGRGLPGYFLVSILYFIIWMLGNIVLYVVSAPYEPKDAPAPLASVQRVTMAQMYTAAVSNKLIMALFISISLSMIAWQVFGTGVMYYFQYSIGNLMWQATAGTIGGFATLGFAIICPMFARRIGKKNSFIFQYVWLSLCYLFMMFFADGNVWVYIIIFGIVGLGNSMAMTWGVILWLDAAEIQLHEKGVDNRPFVMAVSNIPIKIGFIASGPVVAFLLNNSGYQVDSAGVGSLASTQMFMYVWLGIVVALYILAGIIFFFGYNTSEQYAAECAAANAAADEERAAAAAAAN